MHVILVQRTEMASAIAMQWIEEYQQAERECLAVHYNLAGWRHPLLTAHCMTSISGAKLHKHESRLANGDGNKQTDARRYARVL